MPTERRYSISDNPNFQRDLREHLSPAKAPKKALLGDLHVRSALKKVDEEYSGTSEEHLQDQLVRLGISKAHS